MLKYLVRKFILIAIILVLLSIGMYIFLTIENKTEIQEPHQNTQKFDLIQENWIIMSETIGIDSSETSTNKSIYNFQNKYKNLTVSMSDTLYNYEIDEIESIILIIEDDLTEGNYIITEINSDNVDIMNLENNELLSFQIN